MDQAGESGRLHLDGVLAVELHVAAWCDGDRIRGRRPIVVGRIIRNVRRNLEGTLRLVGYQRFLLCTCIGNGVHDLFGLQLDGAERVRGVAALELHIGLTIDGHRSAGDHGAGWNLIVEALGGVDDQIQPLLDWEASTTAESLLTVTGAVVAVTPGAVSDFWATSANMRIALLFTQVLP